MWWSLRSFAGDKPSRGSSLMRPRHGGNFVLSFRALLYLRYRFILGPGHIGVTENRKRPGQTEATKWGHFEGRQLRLIPFCRIGKRSPGAFSRQRLQDIGGQKPMQRTTTKFGKNVEVEQLNIFRPHRKVILRDCASLQCPAVTSHLIFGLDQPKGGTSCKALLDVSA